MEAPNLGSLTILPPQSQWIQHLGDLNLWFLFPNISTIWLWGKDPPFIKQGNHLFLWAMASMAMLDNQSVYIYISVVSIRDIYQKDIWCNPVAAPKWYMKQVFFPQGNHDPPLRILRSVGQILPQGLQFRGVLGVSSPRVFSILRQLRSFLKIEWGNGA
jgi:hypothetical protein